MIEVGSHTVLVFVKLQFLGQWSRFSGTDMVAYNAARPGQLLVVTEDESAAKTTYWFRLAAGQEVWVIEDVVHIPAICLKARPAIRPDAEASQRRTLHRERRAPV